MKAKSNNPTALVFSLQAEDGGQWQLEGGSEIQGKRGRDTKGHGGNYSALLIELLLPGGKHSAFEFRL